MLSAAFLVMSFFAILKSINALEGLEPPQQI